MTVSGLRKGIKMAEAGQRDDNIMRPDGTVAPSIDRRPEWKAERARMITHIASSVMDTMSDEEMYRRARSTVVESQYYDPDHKLISTYEKHGGAWTEIMHEKYRFKENKVEEFQVDSQDDKATTPEKIKVTPEHKEIHIADVDISEEARRKKEAKRRNLYS
jgi:hypothetical protein